MKIRHGLSSSHDSIGFNMAISVFVCSPLKLKPLNARIMPSFSFLCTSASSSSDDQSTLVSTVVSILTHHRSKSRWSHLRSLLQTSCLTASQFSQIALNIKSNPHLAIRFFFFTVQNSLCHHNLQSYSTIIHLLSRARLKARVQSLIRDALASPTLLESDDATAADSASIRLFKSLLKTYRICDSAPFVFDLLIKACLESKKIDEAIQIVRFLRSRGIIPLVATCNYLISSVARSKGCYAGYAIFREVFDLNDDELNSRGENKRVVFFSPNVHSFNALMLGFYRERETDMIEEVWKEMERYGCAANDYSYSILMSVLCNEGKMREANKLWEEMRLKGIKPDLVAYNTIIGGFCKSGEIDKAKELLVQMNMNRLESSSATFEHLIRGFCDAGDIDSASIAYRDMRDKGFRPEASTLEVLIGQLCKKQKVFEALEIKRDVTKVDSFTLSRRSYKFLIKGLCDDGKMEEALKLQTEMVGKGFEPDSNIYCTFVEGHQKLGNKEMVATLRKEMYEAKMRQQ